MLYENSAQLSKLCIVDGLLMPYGTDREQKYWWVLTLHSKGRSPVCIIM